MTSTTDRSQRGSILLALLILAALSAAIAGAGWRSCEAVARELRARRAVLCARYAALGALAAWPDHVEPSLFGGRHELRLSAVTAGGGGGRCSVLVEAVCDGARRVLSRPTDAGDCLRFQPLPNSIRWKADVHHTRRSRGLR